MTARLSGLSVALLAAGFAATLAISVAPGQANEARKKWWPSEFGAEDQVGAANRLTPAKVLAAKNLIKTGEVIDMTRVYEDSMPLFDLTAPHTRKFIELVIMGNGGGPAYGPMAENKLAWNEDFLAGHITQDGTQFDSFAHMGTLYTDESGKSEIRYYNGFRHADIANGQGFLKLGVEHVPPFFTKGILIDIRGYLGRTMKKGEEFSVADIKGALKRQGMSEKDIEPGDALFYNTGWGELWKINNSLFNSGTPGLSPAAGDWVAAKKVLLVGTDNWAVEAFPNPNPALFAPNHQKFLIEHGIYIMENLDFTKLIEKGVYTFAFVYGAMPIKGATGSPGRAFAIH